MSEKQCLHCRCYECRCDIQPDGTRTAISVIEENNRLADENEKLKAQVRELEEAIYEAYMEGYDDAYSQCNTGKEPEDCIQFAPVSSWDESGAKKQTEEAGDE